MVLSVFVSCPYIKLCLKHRQVQFGNGNPSVLTEVMPGVVLAFPGLLFIGLIAAGEMSLCSYFSSSAEVGAASDSPGWPIATAVLLGLAGFFAMCRGALVTVHSALFVFAGGGVLASSVAFGATRQPRAALSGEAVIV